MKKLALALVCLMGVAFFTSCDKDPVVENPEPSIVVLAQEGYLADGDVIDVNVEYPYGFRAASNPDTQKELYKLVVTCTVDEVTTYLCDSLISGTEFTFEGSISFEAREIIGEAEIIATVTDNDGKTNTASFKISVNKEDNLVAYGFTWNRHGGQPATGLEPFGLKWEKNAEKDIYAVIEPLEGAQLYCFENAKVWDETQTEAQLAALFSEATTATQFKEVSCTAGDKDYNLVIGTTYNGYNYLINVTHSHAESFKGTDVTITGEFK